MSYSMVHLVSGILLKWSETFVKSVLWAVMSYSMVRSRVQNFPVWHTKAAPNGKCCEGYIVPSRVTIHRCEKCVEIKGDYVKKQQSCFISVTLKSLSGRKLLDPTTYMDIFYSFLRYLLSPYLRQFPFLRREKKGENKLFRNFCTHPCFQRTLIFEYAPLWCTEITHSLYTPPESHRPVYNPRVLLYANRTKKCRHEEKLNCCRYVKYVRCRKQLKHAVVRDMWLTSRKCDFVMLERGFFFLNVGCI